ncbi:copper amine oxidase N-terminal domain-containing protein [Paenibacillus sp. IB182496]|uniref:Copper amine oxidase N-terminal domain-containing protein n=1 Tax=Paenibacillus sabuli TaxID=2772509 RepID=A0A927BQT7_9BACL|nr:copper amine oxidase N-terminal domain-containing protein [Paenibacillus sabuli]MBD2845052.1 copper amine oxidase N-terminal domain-containing protein [Paenibacillus sabuli]
MKKYLKKTVVPALGLALALPSLAMAQPAYEQDDATDTSIGNLRAELGQNLGEHAALAVIVMQKGIDGADDFDEAAGALANNTDDLAASIGKVYGDLAAQDFEEMWSAHIGFFVDYVEGEAAGDEAMKDEALEDLSGYKEDFSEFLAGATGQEADTIAQGLQTHVEQLIGAFDDYVDEDYDEAYDSMRDAYGHMYMTAKLLSAGIADRYVDTYGVTDADTPAVDLRAKLSEQLGEHAILAVLAMQKGIDGAPDFGAAADALNANTEALTASIGAVYGEEAADAFHTIWTNHIGYFVDYVTATAANDREAKQEALDDLAQYKQDFSEFLAGANPNLEAAALAEGLQTHIEQLIGSFDDYVAADYDDAYSAEREAYQHMHRVGALLSKAIVSQFSGDGDTGSDMDMDGPQKIWLGVDDDKLIVDDMTIPMDVEPFIERGTTYVPLRFMSEAVGADIRWDNTTKTAWIMTGGNTAEFWAGMDEMELNGERMDVGHEVKLRDGRVQIPLRFITELLGWSVHYNGADGSITLKKT